MSSDYLIIHKSVLPDYFLKVIEVKKALEERKYANISDAVKAVGISRSTYYKYKDYVFVADGTTGQRKATISLTLDHETGTLARVLQRISFHHASILTISQSVPISYQASVLATVDITNLSSTVEELLLSLQHTMGVSKARLDSVE